MKRVFFNSSHFHSLYFFILTKPEKTLWNQQHESKSTEVWWCDCEFFFLRRMESFARLPLNSNDNGFFLRSFISLPLKWTTYIRSCSAWHRTQSKSILIFIILIHCGNTQAMVRCSVNWKFERRWSFSMNSVDFFSFGARVTCCPLQLLIFCAATTQPRFFCFSISARHLSSRSLCVRDARARSPFFEFLIFFYCV